MGPLSSGRTGSKNQRLPDNQQQREKNSFFITSLGGEDISVVIGTNHQDPTNKPSNQNSVNL